MVLAFLFSLAPSFFLLAIKVLWRGSLYNHHLASSRRTRLPKNSIQLPFLFFFSRFFFLSSSLPGLPQVDTLCPRNCVSRHSRTLTPIEVLIFGLRPRTNSIYDSSSIIVGILYNSSRNYCTYLATFQSDANLKSANLLPPPTLLAQTLLPWRR